MRLLILLILSGLIVSSCNRTASLEELQIYIADETHGIKQSHMVGQTKVSVAYRPTDLMVADALDNQFDSLKKSILEKKYNSIYYFVLSISSDNKETLHQLKGNGYGELLQTLSFNMRSHVSLTTNNRDTIPLSDYIMNNTYGVGQSTDLMFAFKHQTNEVKWVQFNLNEFGLGLGNLQFRFEQEDLDNVPHIKY